jgi:hypothetical protein
MEADFDIVVSLFVTATGGRNVFHVVIIDLLGRSFSPKRVVGVVGDCPCIVAFARRASWGMRRTHLGYFVSKESRWREKRFKDAIMGDRSFGSLIDSTSFVPTPQSTYLRSLSPLSPIFMDKEMVGQPRLQFC